MMKYLGQASQRLLFLDVFPKIFRGYIDNMKFAAFMAFTFITFFHVLLVPFFIIVYMVVCFVYFCLIL
jgi:hypothetical protein